MKRSTGYLVILLVAALLGIWGCPKKTEVNSSPEGAATAPSSVQEPAKAEPEKSAQPSQPSETSPESSAVAAEGLKPVYFDFDQSLIRNDQKQVLTENASWLKAHPKTKIRIEGNCDERGTREYNQALGQRRAAAAKKYLTALGVSAGRISLISYGKEKPVCTESAESCWQKNRKDDFAVTQ